MIKIPEETINTIITEKMMIAMQLHIPFQTNSKYYAGYDAATDTLALGIKTYLISNAVHEETKETFTYPATWWDGFKEKYVPKVPKLVQKWFSEAKYITKDTKITHIHACPHHNIPFGKEHISFLITDDIKTVHNSKIKEKRIKEIKQLLDDGRIMIPTRFDSLVNELRDLERDM